METACGHINSLNDDVLLLIFGHLPVDDLLRAELVCRRWATIQARCCSTKIALVLLDSDLLDFYRQWCEYYGFFERSYCCLQIDFLSKPVTYFLARKFPHISQLEIVQSDLGAVLGPVVYLLKQWRRYLSHLRVITGSHPFVQQFVSTAWPRLFCAINDLPALRHLTLHDTMRLPDNVQFPDLSRLEEFCIHGFSCRYLEKVLAQVAECKQLHKLTIGTECPGNCPLDGQLNDLKHSVTHFSLVHRFRAELSANYLFVISTNFLALTSLRLELDCPVDLLARHLCTLSQLRLLRLAYQMKNFLIDAVDGRQCQLPAVRTLHLDCSIVPHVCVTSSETLSCLDTIRVTFPQLQCIKLDTAFRSIQVCLACNQDSISAAESCLQSVRYFPQLTTVYLPAHLNAQTPWLNTERYLARYKVYHFSKSDTNCLTRFECIEI